MVVKKTKREIELEKTIKKYRQDFRNLEDKVEVYGNMLTQVQGELAKQTVEKNAIIKIVGQWYDIAIQLAEQAGIHPPEGYVPVEGASTKKNYQPGVT